MADYPRDPRSFHVSLDDSGPAPSPVPSRPDERGPAGPVPPPRPKKRRRRWPWVVVAVFAFMFLGGLFFAFSAWSIWGDVEKVDLSAVAAGDGATNYLIVGTDSRAGVDPENPNAGVIFGEGDGGERTDTIAVLNIAGGDAKLLAIPRDLWVPIAGGEPGRINAAFNRGPETLVDTVQRELDIGIDHYLEVDFAGFLGLVDALGGVTIDFEHPAHDPKSGLNVTETGPVRLGQDEALAYVRSRTYTETIDGSQVVDPTADLGRVQRQQKFLGAVFSELGDTRNPFTLLDVGNGVKSNVRVDDDMSFTDALKLGWTLRGLDPAPFTVATTPHRTSGGAAVLLLDAGAAEPVLAMFR